MTGTVIGNITKTELSNGNYDVKFTLDGVEQLWCGVKPENCETDDIFVQFVKDTLAANEEAVE